MHFGKKSDTHLKISDQRVRIRTCISTDRAHAIAQVTGLVNLSHRISIKEMRNHFAGGGSLENNHNHAICLLMLKKQNKQEKLFSGEEVINLEIFLREKERVIDQLPPAHT